MSRRRIAIGIDIGTSNVRVVIAEYTDDKTLPSIIGTGVFESRGLRHGYIVNFDEAVGSIRSALKQAEKNAGIAVKKAFVAVGGLSLESVTGSGSVFVSRADGEVTESDAGKAIEIAEETLTLGANRQVIHRIPVSFNLDGEEVLGRPTGMKGSKLDAKVLFITCLQQHLSDFIHAVEEAGVSVEDICPAPIAASFVTLTKRQKTAGVALANIGAETLSLVIFENNIPISLKVFPIGGVEITNDIALGLKIPLDEAEMIKRGSVITQYPKKKLEDIIEARLSDIFNIIEAHLKKNGKSGLLPAGIVLTGGTSALPLIEEISRVSLKLPSKVSTPDFAKNTKEQIKDALWAVAYGLSIMDGNEGAVAMPIKNPSAGALSWLKQFLP